MRKLLIVLGLAIAASAFAAEALVCKYDGVMLFFNGKTRVVWGVIEYQCTCGTHRYWLTEVDCSQ